MKTTRLYSRAWRIIHVVAIVMAIFVILYSYVFALSEPIDIHVRHIEIEKEREKKDQERREERSKEGKSSERDRRKSEEYHRKYDGTEMQTIH